MLTRNQPPTMVLSMVTNLLREYYPGITAESLLSILGQRENSPKNNVIKKKLTRKECAELLGVSINSINRYIQNGNLKAVNISPRLVRIDPESVQNLLTHGITEDKIISLHKEAVL